MHMRNSIYYSEATWHLYFSELWRGEADIFEESTAQLSYQSNIPLLFMVEYKMH